jgi:small-conductance mechanosensitive channel
MQRKNNSSDPQQKKSIADLEAELDQLQEKVKQQAIDIRKKLKDSRNAESIPIELPTGENLEEEEAKYTLEQAQAELFADIITLEKLILNYQDGRLNSEIYHLQLKSILYNILKFKLILEKKAFNIDEFLKTEKSLRKATRASQKLKEMKIIF